MRLSQLEHILAATQALQSVLAQIPALSGLSEADCLKAAPGRAAFKARIGGQDLVLKLLTGPENAALTRTHARVLADSARRMGAGLNRVPGLIDAFPEHGLLLMDWVPGQNMSKGIFRADPGARAALLRRAAGWLDWFVADTRSEGRIATGFWQRELLKYRTELSDTYQFSGISVVLVEFALAQIATLADQPVTRAFTHGDFKPDNLMVDGDVLWGIDLEQAGERALGVEIAYVQFELGHRPPDLQVDPAYGAALVDVAPFIERGLISDTEARAVLPFFMAMLLAKHCYEVQPKSGESAYILASERFLAAMT